MAPLIDPALCNACGICHDVCPQDVFTHEPKSKSAPRVAYPVECWYCGACVIDCPRQAITLRLPLPLHIVPSPALYGPPGPEEADALRRAADFSRSITAPPASDGGPGGSGGGQP